MSECDSSTSEAANYLFYNRMDHAHIDLYFYLSSALTSVARLRTFDANAAAPNSR